MSEFHSRDEDERIIKEIQALSAQKVVDELLTKSRYLEWLRKAPFRTDRPANPYADPQSPESLSINDPANPFVQRASTVIKGYKAEGASPHKGEQS